jgi:hypothetical protein
MTSPNSSCAHGDPAGGISRIAPDRDLIVAGSSVLHARAAADAVDD